MTFSKTVELADLVECLSDLAGPITFVRDDDALSFDDIVDDPCGPHVSFESRGEKYGGYSV